MAEAECVPELMCDHTVERRLVRGEVPGNDDIALGGIEVREAIGERVATDGPADAADTGHAGGHAGGLEVIERIVEEIVRRYREDRVPPPAPAILNT